MGKARIRTNVGVLAQGRRRGVVEDGNVPRCVQVGDRRGSFACLSRAGSCVGARIYRGDVFNKDRPVQYQPSTPRTPGGRRNEHGRERES